MRVPPVENGDIGCFKFDLLRGVLHSYWLARGMRGNVLGWGFLFFFPDCHCLVLCLLVGLVEMEEKRGVDILSLSRGVPKAMGYLSFLD